MGRLSCHSVVWVAAWILLGLPTPARAAPELFINLKYDVDPALSDCMADAEFRSLVARQVGYDPYRAGVDLGVEVRVRLAEHEIQGTIEWNSSGHGRIGERRFASETRECNTTLATMGFALAVQIQLMAMEPAPEPSLEPPHNEKTDTPSAQPGAEHDRGRSVAASGGLGASTGLGLGPNPVAQGRLFLSLGFGRASSEVGVEATLPATTRQGYGGGFRHQLVLGTWAGCGSHGSSALCLVVKLGQLRVGGVGVDKPASPGGFLAQTGLRLGYSLGLGDHLVLAGHADAIYALTAWTVQVNHVAVWTMPRLSALVGIDLGLRFW
jgi:hypothetical protein